MQRRIPEDISQLPKLVQTLETKLNSRYIFLAEVKEIHETLAEIYTALITPVPRVAPQDEKSPLLIGHDENKAEEARVNIYASLENQIKRLSAETERLLHEAIVERKVELNPTKDVERRSPAADLKKADVYFHHKELLGHTAGFLSFREMLRLGSTSKDLNDILHNKISVSARSLVVGELPYGILLFNPRRLVPNVQQRFASLHQLLADARRKDPSINDLDEKINKQFGGNYNVSGLRRACGLNFLMLLSFVLFIYLRFKNGKRDDEPLDLPETVSLSATGSALLMMLYDLTRYIFVIVPNQRTFARSNFSSHTDRFFIADAPAAPARNENKAKSPVPERK